MTVNRLEDEMSAREFFEWVEYSNEEPLLNDRIEIMLAQLTALTNNIHSKKKLKPVDFLVSMSNEKKKAHKLSEAGGQMMEYLSSKIKKDN